MPKRKTPARAMRKPGETMQKAPDQKVPIEQAQPQEARPESDKVVDSPRNSAVGEAVVDVRRDEHEEAYKAKVHPK